MKTKVANEMKATIPAGIISGIEGFWHDGEKWIIANGQVQRFHDAPTGVQQMVWRHFFADTYSQHIIKNLGITKLTETFDRWYRCVVGGLDHIPDFGSMLMPDNYNNMCTDTSCTLRGKLCSRGVGLKNYEVETLRELESGESLEHAASDLCISLPAIKSRVEKIKEKLHAPNMAAMVATSARLGI